MFIYSFIGDGSGAISSIDSMSIKSQLRLSGHLTYLEGNSLLKQDVYGEFVRDKSLQCKPHNRYENWLKESPEKVQIALNT